VPFRPVGSQERAQVELVDDVEHEPRQMLWRQPLADIDREQKRLVAVAGRKL
jgi:hypothetical protein